MCFTDIYTGKIPIDIKINNLFKDGSGGSKRWQQIQGGRYIVCGLDGT